MKIKKSISENNLLDFDNNIYLNVDSLTDIYMIAAGLNNLVLRKIDVKP